MMMALPDEWSAVLSPEMRQGARKAVLALILVYSRRPTRVLEDLRVLHNHHRARASDNPLATCFQKLRGALADVARAPGIHDCKDLCKMVSASRQRLHRVHAEATALAADVRRARRTVLRWNMLRDESRPLKKCEEELQGLLEEESLLSDDEGDADVDNGYNSGEAGDDDPVALNDVGAALDAV